MPSTTSRLGLTAPLTTDADTQIRLSITGNADTLDNAAMYQSGTLAARAALSPVAGTFYYGTDTKLLYEYDGTEWLTALVAGAWQNLTLASGVSSGGIVPAARLVGDTVHFKGILQNTSGSAIGATSPLATLPSSSFYPLTFDAILPTSIQASATAAQLVVNEVNGTLFLQESFPAGSTIWLGGLWYPLAN